MPVQFLTTEQRANYGRYVTEPTVRDLAVYFHLDDTDRQHIANKRNEHNRLGFALQLTTVRYLGRFLDTMTQMPHTVLNALVKQLGISDPSCLTDYYDQRQRLRHIEEISQAYGYCEVSTPLVGFRLTRWLYAACWTGTDRPLLFFERATTWLLANKVLLPGASILERFIAKLKQRVEERLWKMLSQKITLDQQAKLEGLFLVPEGSSRSHFEQLRAGGPNSH